VALPLLLLPLAGCLGSPPSDDDAAWRARALAVLAEEPALTAGDRTHGWDAYFNQSYLARSGAPPPDPAWFEDHPSTVERAGQPPEVRVAWLGLPGCEHDPSQPGGPDEGPNWFDAQGERCLLLWRFTVRFAPDGALRAVEVAEVGGIA